MLDATELSTRQTQFIHEYLACGNATASAIKAGFSPNGASVAGNRMLRNANVQKALQAAQAADANRLSISRENVLEWLQSAFLTAREKGDPAAMVSAAREIGRMLGFYAPEVRKVALSTEQRGVRSRMEDMTDAELLAVIADAATH